jgi:hypothetical protein
MLRHQVELPVAKNTVAYRRGYRKGSRGEPAFSKSTTEAAGPVPYVVHWVIDEKKSRKTATAGSKAGSKIPSQRHRDADGKMVPYRFIDVRSATFGADFDEIFRSNVRKARRANKRIVGTADRGAVKG